MMKTQISWLLMQLTFRAPNWCPECHKPLLWHYLSGDRLYDSYSLQINAPNTNVHC